MHLTYPYLDPTVVSGLSLLYVPILKGKRQGEDSIFRRPIRHCMGLSSIFCVFEKIGGYRGISGLTPLRLLNKQLVWVLGLELSNSEISDVPSFRFRLYERGLRVPACYLSVQVVRSRYRLGVSSPNRCCILYAILTSWRKTT